MSSYIGRHAELYDLFYAEKDYAGEAAFVDQCVHANGGSGRGPMLELACGTGRHAIEFGRLGYDVVATDYSEDMLAQAKARSHREGSGAAFQQADMREVNLAGQRFDTAVCLFDSIGYVQTNDAVREVLLGVWEHLNAGGLFVFEYWHAAAMLVGYDPVRVKRWSTDSGQIIRISETSVDTANQTCRVDYTIYELRPDGSYTEIRESQVNRFFLVQEMSVLLKSAGFELLRCHAGFFDDENIDENTWHVVAVARKADRAAMTA